MYKNSFRNLIRAKITMTDKSITTESMILELIPKKKFKGFFIYIHNYHKNFLNHFNWTN